eukprot:5243196-Pleurochrysis_carterae.AAC.1
MAEILLSVLGEKLYPVSDGVNESPDDLRGKVIVKGKKLAPLFDVLNGSAARCGSDVSSIGFVPNSGGGDTSSDGEEEPAEIVRCASPQLMSSGGDVAEALCGVGVGGGADSGAGGSSDGGAGEGGGVCAGPLPESQTSPGREQRRCAFNLEANASFVAPAASTANSSVDSSFHSSPSSTTRRSALMRRSPPLLRGIFRGGGGGRGSSDNGGGGDEGGGGGVDDGGGGGDDGGDAGGDAGGDGVRYAVAVPGTVGTVTGSSDRAVHAPSAKSSVPPLRIASLPCAPDKEPTAASCGSPFGRLRLSESDGRAAGGWALSDTSDSLTRRAAGRTESPTSMRLPTSSPSLKAAPTTTLTSALAAPLATEGAVAGAASGAAAAAATAATTAAAAAAAAAATASVNEEVSARDSASSAVSALGPWARYSPSAR